MADKKLNIWVRLKGAGTAQKSMSKLGSGVSNVVAGFQTLAGILAGGILIRMAADMVKIAAKAEGVERAFKRLNQGGLLNDLRKATKGAVSDLELMQGAVRAENFDIPLKNLAKLMEFAQQRARATGESVEFLTQSIVMGIGRKSPLILDNLGLNVVRVREEFKKTGDMAQAVANIAEIELKKMGTGARTSADDIEGLSAAWTNLSVALGKLVTSAGATGVLQDWAVMITALSTPGATMIKPLTDEAEIKRLKGQIWAFKTLIELDPAKFTEKYTETIRGLEYQLSLLGEKLDKGVTRQEKWNIKQLAAIENAKEIAQWTKELNMQLIIQAGLLDRELDTGDSITARVQATEIMAKSQEAIGIEAKKSAKVVDTAYTEIINKYKTMGDLANNFSSMWSQALLNQWNEGQNFFDNMVRGFKQMLAAMLAELIAKAAIFAIFEAIMPGSGSLAKLGSSVPGLGADTSGSFFPGGGGDLRAGGGGTTIIINNPIMDKRHTEQMVIQQIERAKRKGRI